MEAPAITKTATTCFDVFVGVLGPVVLCVLLIFTSLRMGLVLALLAVLTFFFTFVLASATRRSLQVFQSSTLVGALLVLVLFLTIEQVGSTPYGNETSFQTVALSLRNLFSMFGVYTLIAVATAVCGAAFLGAWFGRSVKTGRVDV